MPHRARRPAPAARTPSDRSTLLTVSDLEVTYAPPRRRGSLGTGAALTGVDLTVYEGEILGIIGETGSGKTTLARATVGLVRPAHGTIGFDGRGPRRTHRPGAAQLPAVGPDPARVPGPAAVARRGPQRA